MGSQSKQWVIGLCVLVLVGGVTVWYLNRGYDKVSEQGYQYAMALMSACNRRDEARVEAIVSKIEADRKAGDMPGDDAKTLTGIANRALDGNWDSAATAIRRLLQDQVELP